MDSDLASLQNLVPDILKIVRQRFFVPERISLLAPVGRRVVAKKLRLSERNVRAETGYLRQLGLINVQSYGMELTDKGKRTLKEIVPLIDRLFNASQTEIELAQKLDIDRAVIVSGDVDRQERVVDLMGEQFNSVLGLPLSLGKSIITVLGGTTIAGVARHFSPKLSRYRDLLFVPGRRAVGESVEIQGNTVAQMMASGTGSRYKGLYLSENVSPEALTLLLQDTDITSAVSNIYNSDVMMHGVGRADVVSRRRGLDIMTNSKPRNDGAVAECFGYFSDQQGRLVKRIPRISLQLEGLNKIPHVFAIVAGTSEAAAIAACMHHTPKQTWLITDEGASNLVLKGR